MIHKSKNKYTELIMILSVQYCFLNLTHVILWKVNWINVCWFSGRFQRDGGAAKGAGASRATEESKRSELNSQHEHYNDFTYTDFSSVLSETVLH